MITAPAFIAKWGAPDGVPGPAYHLNEEQGAQSHFLDLCELLAVPKPGSAPGYLFEEKSKIIGGKTGYADVFMRGVFAWENKAPGKNLDAALKQLLTYSLALENPPILVVSDRLSIRIHTQFTGHPSQTHTVALAEMDQPDKLALLRRIWTAPESFKPRQTNRDITEAAARSFAALAQGLRASSGLPPHQVAHFLTQCVFCFFAEDVGLLPGRMLERLVNNRHITPERLTQGLGQLFAAMQTGGLYGADDIPWFNGGLFQTIAVPPLSAPNVAELRTAAGLDWSAIDVSIFGTLFERGLDPAKRSQLGAHYTDTATIERIIDPVLRRPLLQKWELVAQEIRGLMAKSKRRNDKAHQEAQRCFVQWLEALAAFRALDPACGSGNFLYLALKALKDVEHQSHLQAADLGLDRQTDLVTGPHNVLGIELNEYAAELARVTVWIGELQWRLAHGYAFKMNPVLEALEHIECRDALLTFGESGLGAGEVSALVGGAGGAGQEGPGLGAHEPAAPKSPQSPAPPAPLDAAVVSETPWPAADVVIGNPPFLGDRKMIRELGEAYTAALRKTYEGRVPGGADLVCYWFEKARAQLAAGQLQRAGLVTTNSIRGGANRKVLDAICAETRIFEAWSDERWVNEGAAVRVSLVAFGSAEQAPRLDGLEVNTIAADLSAHTDANATDLTQAKRLPSNTTTSFIGTQKNGPFDVPHEVAVQWFQQPNPHGKSNALVIRPWANGLAVTRRPEDTWVIDFDKMTEADSSLFEAPFAHVVEFVKPTRVDLRRDWHRLHWWCHGDPRPAMKLALRNIERQIITPRVSKHRVFAWFSNQVLPDSAVVSIARADDTTFGILHSRFHELWSLRMGTSLEDRPRYTPTTCFETFPFPEGLTPADTAHQRTEVLEGGARIPAGLEAALAGAVSAAADSTSNQAIAPAQQAQAAIKNIPLKTAATAIAQAAHRLDLLRQNWLNPPEWVDRVPEVVPLGMAASPYPARVVAKPGFEKELAKRTLTNLYNQRPAWLAAAHQALDAAVAAAYGWTDYAAGMTDETILQRLLALNLARQKNQK
ncbi:MAG: hypothetical protein PHU77_05785 [Simplicispira sp.]|nr:hypothetical protein [Simplicispira sp.]